MAAVTKDCPRFGGEVVTLEPLQKAHKRLNRVGTSVKNSICLFTSFMGVAHSYQAYWCE